MTTTVVDQGIPRGGGGHQRQYENEKKMVEGRITSRSTTALPCTFTNL